MNKDRGHHKCLYCGFIFDAEYAECPVCGASVSIASPGIGLGSS